MSPSSHDITDSNIDLAIKVFKNILTPGNNLLIVSKPKLDKIQKICKELKYWKNQILFRFTIGTLNDEVRAFWEPGAPHVKERIKALEYAFNTGWKTSVSIEPYLDANVIELVKKLEPFITDTLWIGPMNKIHVPKELWNEKQEELYSVEFRSKIKEKIDRLACSRIRFKDHFLTGLTKD